jgi:hypothetical protein
MNKNIKKYFVEALRSNRFNQSKSGELGFEHQNGNQIHCAMGVLCELATDAGKVEKKVLKEEYTRGMIVYDGIGGFEPDSILEWAEMSHLEASTIRRLNDQKRYSFAKIADYVEENM